MSGNSLRQTVHTRCASVHQAAKLATALLRVAGVTAGLAESNGSLPPGLWLTLPAGWPPRTGISSGTLRSVIEYGLPLPFYRLSVNKDLYNINSQQTHNIMTLLFYSICFQRNFLTASDLLTQWKSIGRSQAHSRFISYPSICLPLEKGTKRARVTLFIYSSKQRLVLAGKNAFVWLALGIAYLCCVVVTFFGNSSDVR